MKTSTSHTYALYTHNARKSKFKPLVQKYTYVQNSEICTATSGILICCTQTNYHVMQPYDSRQYSLTPSARGKGDGGDPAKSIPSWLSLRIERTVHPGPPNYSTHCVTKDDDEVTQCSSKRFRIYEWNSPLHCGTGTLRLLQGRGNPDFRPGAMQRVARN